MIVLYDDTLARQCEPFATTRPLGEVRAGAFLGRERWASWFGSRIDACITAAHLADFREFESPPMWDGSVATSTWLVNSRALPVVTSSPVPHDGARLIRINGRVAAMRLSAEQITDDLLDALRVGGFDLDRAAGSAMTAVDVEGVWLRDTWDIIRHLTVQLMQDVPALAGALDIAPYAAAHASANNVTVLGAHPVFVESNARIEPFVMLDASAGPILVRRGATIQSFTRIVGPCYIGCDSTVMTDRVASSSIGDMCRVHGELSMSVFIGHANKGHDGFVGHSILGRWVNLGAGTITSNLKNTYGSVSMWSPRGLQDTEMQFAGTFFGDHAKTGIGLRLTTGCVLGAGANVMDSMPPKVVAPFSWGTGTPYASFAPDKFVETAERMMARRQVAVDAQCRAYFAAILAHGSTDTHWPSR